MFELEALESEIASVQFFPGLSNADANTRGALHSSLQAQCEWLSRMAQQVFECSVTGPETKALSTCLRKSCEKDVTMNDTDMYLHWPRILAIAVKTVPLVGSKSAGSKISITLTDLICILIYILPTMLQEFVWYPAKNRQMGKRGQYRWGSREKKLVTLLSRTEEAR